MTSHGWSVSARYLSNQFGTHETSDVCSPLSPVERSTHPEARTRRFGPAARTPPPHPRNPQPQPLPGGFRRCATPPRASKISESFHLFRVGFRHRHPVPFCIDMFTRLPSHLGTFTLLPLRSLCKTISSGSRRCAPSTPESSKGSPKVNFPLKAVVFNGGERVRTRFRMVLPPPTLWRGCPGCCSRSC